MPLFAIGLGCDNNSRDLAIRRPRTVNFRLARQLAVIAITSPQADKAGIMRARRACRLRRPITQTLIAIECVANARLLAIPQACLVHMQRPPRTPTSLSWYSDTATPENCNYPWRRVRT